MVELERKLSDVQVVVDSIAHQVDSAGDPRSFSDVLTDLGDYAEMNAIYAEYFGAPHPARSAVEVAALPRGARVEIEAIASIAS